ncbi:uncharacterized protein [Rutidosis leptorrhynchoides]|uniref:uncharacterized protein n=1 Tax=Rutidosis leptorrhynchoides TaxID=125765 RepID=UPI003A996873
MTSEEARNSNEVVSGTFVVNSKPAKVLFDCGANLSFVSLKFVNKLDRPLVKLKNPVEVEISHGKTVLGFDECENYDIVFGTESFKIALIPMTLGEFDVVVSMDWLDCMEFLVHVVNTREAPPSIRSIPVVNEFEDVFLDELPGVLPKT